MLPGEGEHNLLLKITCEGEYDEENEECGEDDEDAKIELLDNNRRTFNSEEVNTVIGGSMHYVAKSLKIPGGQKTLMNCQEQNLP